jgi:hypothetical protein
MSVALVVDTRGNLQIRVAVNSTGERPLLLPFAFISGEVVSRYRLRLFVSAADGEHTFSLDNPAMPLRGRFDPLVIPMVSDASYVLELPLAAWWKGRTNRNELEALIGRQGQLWVELDGKYMPSTTIPPLACPLYGYPNPNAITCWQGKLISNRVQLPR